MPRRMLDPAAQGAMRNAACAPPAVAAPAVDQHFLFGRQRDAFGAVGDVQLGEQVDVVSQSLDLYVSGGGRKPHTGLGGKHANRLFDTHQQALARRNAGVPAAGERGVFVTGDMGGLRGGGLYARRAGEHQVRLEQFRECAGLAAAASLDRLVLALQLFRHFILIALCMRLGLLSRLGQTFMLLTPCGQAGYGLAQVFGMRLGAAAAFGGDEQAVFGADGAVAVAAQLKAFASGVLASGVVLYPADVPQAQGAVLVVAFQLRLNLLGRVVEDQVVASACCAVAALWV